MNDERKPRGPDKAWHQCLLCGRSGSRAFVTIDGGATAGGRVCRHPRACNKRRAAFLRPLTGARA